MDREEVKNTIREMKFMEQPLTNSAFLIGIAQLCAAIEFVHTEDGEERYPDKDTLFDRAGIHIEAMKSMLSIKDFDVERLIDESDEKD